MDPDTFRGDVGVEGPDVYWRRRVSVLTGALVVVAIVAWACTSASGGSGRNAADRPPATGSANPAAVPPTLAPASPSPSVTARAGSANSPHRPHAPAPSPAPTRTRHPGDPCEKADLVLSLRGGAGVYADKGKPEFLLTLVNIGRIDCAVDVGPRAVEVRITSGTDRVWSTADCVSGDRIDVRRLQRGVPYVRTIGWDRHRSAPDCRADRPKAKHGTYVARARLSTLKSPKVVFHLR